MDNLTLEQKKQILKDICDEECKEHNLNIKIDIVTIKEYQSKILKQPIKLQKVEEIYEKFMLPFRAAGVHDPKKRHIIIFLKDQIKAKKIEKKLSDNIWTCYHELRHEQQDTLQNQQRDFSYESLMIQISNFCHRGNNDDYWLEHDKYYMEIDADLYAYQKTKEYLMKNYPKTYESQKEYLDFLYQRAKFYQITFDPSFEIERTIHHLKKFKENKEIELAKKKKSTKKPKVSLDYDELSPILSIFLDENVQYKPINHIISNPKFKKLDKRIIYAFFSSKTFLEQLDYNRLRYEELVILKESLEYTINKYQMQIEMLSQEKEIRLDYYLKESKSILHKMMITIDYYQKHFESQQNKYRNQFNIIEHERKLPKILTKVNERIERKNVRRGYITINAFYIAGLLLSVSTIIYLLLK